NAHAGKRIEDGSLSVAANDLGDGLALYAELRATWWRRFRLWSRCHRWWSRCCGWLRRGGQRRGWFHGGRHCRGWFWRFGRLRFRSRGLGWGGRGCGRFLGDDLGGGSRSPFIVIVARARTGGQHDEKCQEKTQE